MKKLRLVPVLLLAGCVLPPSEAEVLTYKAVAPEYAAYVKADTSLTAEQIALRLDTVETWRIRVGSK